MRILVTGGTGVIGRSTITALLQRGHSVRLLCRHADRDAKQWPYGVSPWPGSVADPLQLEGATSDCDAVVHIAGIVEEREPDNTFERVNVQGTRNIVVEAERAGVKRFVYVSSLGAERGTSAYHRSKHDAEEIVRHFRGEYVILRPGAVYGPGDDHMTVLLKMVRTLPAVPLVAGGDKEFQPIWHDDVGEAIARAVELEGIAGRTLELAGGERTSQRDLLQRFRTLTDRDAIAVPVPELLASFGVRAAQTFGLRLGFSESQLTMLLEGNCLTNPSDNALVNVFGITPTPLADGLSMLANAGQELLPDEGIGSLERKRYWADITASRFTADSLFAHVRDHFDELMPRLVETTAEPGARSRVEVGETITLGLALRGHVQVRVAEVADRSFTMLTLEGHPLAGAVRMLVEVRGDALRFEVQVFDRAANVFDFLMMRTLGNRLQDANWTELVRNVVEASGGSTSDVEHTSENLDEAQADRIEEWARELTLALRRDEASV
jgi:uncharacterized protein YbjT (DUF2867 family)